MKLYEYVMLGWKVPMTDEMRRAIDVSEFKVIARNMAYVVTNWEWNEYTGDLGQYALMLEVRDGGREGKYAWRLASAFRRWPKREDGLRRSEDDWLEALISSIREALEYRFEAGRWLNPEDGVVEFTRGVE